MALRCQERGEGPKGRRCQVPALPRRKPQSLPRADASAIVMIHKGLTFLKDPKAIVRRSNITRIRKWEGRGEQFQKCP